MRILAIFGSSIQTRLHVHTCFFKSTKEVLITRIRKPIHQTPGNHLTDVIECNQLLDTTTYRDAVMGRTSERIEVAP